VPQLMKRILEGRNTEGLTAVRACRLMGLWQDIVDEKIKDVTEPIKLVNKVLFVGAKSAVWAQELNYLKSDIINKFNEYAKFEAITDIHFRIMN